MNLSQALSQAMPLAAQPYGWYNADGAGKPVAEQDVSNFQGSKFVRVVLQFLEALPRRGLFVLAC